MYEILITNDDGFEAAGLRALSNTIKQIPNTHVTIVAPSSEKSACGHSLTLTKPLRFISINDDFYKLDDATPSDCVYLSLHALYEKTPDLVISGINHGANVGEDITYSGTCAAAMEAVLQGVKSVAFSQFYKNDSLENLGFNLASEVVKFIVTKILNNEISLPNRQFLNVNIPAVNLQNFKGYKIVPVGNRSYATHAMLNTNPRGVEYYWLGLPSNLAYEQNKECDISVLNEGFASITPIKLDMSAYESLENLKKVFK
ncbi:MAG: 5'/3'-nucleotidase SurE [Campylobacter sp.]